MTRRAQAPKPYEMPDGRFRVRYYDNLGKRLPLYGATPEEAIERWVAATSLVIEPSDPSLKVGDWFTEWLDKWVARRAERTIEFYTDNVEHYLRPRIGHIRLLALTDSQINQVFNDLDAAGNLSGTSQHAVYRTLRAALNSAIKHKAAGLKVSPLGTVDAPRKDTKKVRPWTIEEVSGFFDAIKGDPQEAMFLVAITTGLRQSELLGLRWQDVNLKHARLTVAGTLTRKGAWQPKAKTEDSENDVDIPAFVVEALETHKRRMAQVRFRWNRRWAVNNKVDLVFTTKFGGPLAQRNASTMFTVRMARAGVRRQRFHDMRHTAAAIQIEGGASIAEVAAFLRHKGDGVTGATRTYTHLYTEAKERAAARTEALFPGRQKAVNG